MMQSIRWESRQTMKRRSQYEIFHYADREIAEVSLHHHDFYEIYILEAGNVQYSVEGRNYILQAGDVLLLSPNELHSMRKLDGSLYERFVIWIAPNWLKTLSAGKTDLTEIFTRCSRRRNNVCSSTPAVHREIVSYLERIYELKDSELFGDSVRANTQLIELLLYLYSLFLQGGNAQASTNTIVETTIRYIGEHIDGKLSLDELAKQFFLSPSRLSHLFKQEMGTSVYQYIIKRRLLEAKILLLRGVAASQVAEQCGFGGYQCFLNHFKKEYGLTPTEFVRMNEA